ncbi:MoxR-like ATPase [Proteiniborus ethanoligenes]|uniref:MoxR-like ATPase n=1 Tax=Proteiniborus ethanoligenes TaxID=415015 RepID=A0A1H3R0Y1_9FIRM|nr:MoxR family ATPase [Proteiniborus ethanoligenes]SDZ19337.1 MoxR-like ATPase [Proteiniborus ethanoligenes]
MEIKKISEIASKVRSNIQKVIVGKDTVIDLILTSIISSGHVLLEDVPGLGKTMLARSLARSVDCDYKRIQFTPDLLPSDILGLNYFNQKTGEFQLKEGPIMSQIVLADEINRATPRTQSSLLEAMEEHQVSIDGTTYRLKEPFFVIATQNPIETSGTFPLPEAQLDRFFMKLSMGYPKFDDEFEILMRFKDKDPMKQIGAVITPEEIIEARQSYSRVYVDKEIAEYILKIVRATRDNDEIELGISPRGSLALFKASQAYAAINGRDYVLPDDVKLLTKPVFTHRIILNSHAEIKGRTIDDVLDHIILKINVPVEKNSNI